MYDSEFGGKVIEYREFVAVIVVYIVEQSAFPVRTQFSSTFSTVTVVPTLAIPLIVGSKKDVKYSLLISSGWIVEISSFPTQEIDSIVNGNHCCEA